MRRKWLYFIGLGEEMKFELTEGLARPPFFNTGLTMSLENLHAGAATTSLCWTG